ncbi:MAG: ATP-grasp domain-containing protein, partial [Patescibacteria group bacterium]
LVLDYFMPYEVLGDNPFTKEVEAPVPYPLAVRVLNVGYGSAASLKIDSAQPKIVSNAQGLLIDFKLLGSSVIAPAPVSPEVQAQARRLAERVLSVFGGTGVFGIEMFLTSEGDVLVNEVAPRVHNSGHFTIEACTTSQFEQHVRAVAGLPLGKADMKVPAAVMINILADRTGLAKPRGVEQAESLGDVTVHIYGKKEARPERKMGHITVCAQTVEEAVAKAKAARVCISI